MAPSRGGGPPPPLHYDAGCLTLSRLMTVLHSTHHADRVLILDFGSQVTQLIARRLRESGVYCEIHPFNMSDEKIAAFGAKAVILSGGPASVTEMASPRAPDKVFGLGVPVL